MTTNQPGGAATPSTVLSPVYNTDSLVVVRAGVSYLATIRNILSAGSPPGTGSALQFNNPSNSAYAGAI